MGENTILFFNLRKWIWRYHCLIQCWSIFMISYDIVRPQWVKPVPRYPVLQKMQNPVSPNRPSMVDGKAGWSVSFLGSPPINNLLIPCSQSKNGQNGPNGVCILLRHLDIWYQYICEIVSPLSLENIFCKNLKNPLVAKQTIYGRTLGRPVDSWVAFGKRATIFQQHSLSLINLLKTLVLQSATSCWLADTVMW